MVVIVIVLSESQSRLKALIVIKILIKPFSHIGLFDGWYEIDHGEIPLNNGRV